MNWVDGLIALVVVVAAIKGFRDGATRQIGSLLGLVVGFFAGAWVAPLVALKVTSSSWRPVVAIAIFITCLSLGSSLGRFLGGLVATSLKVVLLGAFDSAAGAGIASVIALVSCWLAASVVVSLSWFSVGGAVNSSSLVRVLDKVMPPASVIEGRVMSAISSADFPQVFSSVISPTIPTINTPAEAVAALEVGNSTASVVKVIARNACGIDSEGTGFVVAPNEVLTNFHVVAGAGEVSVDGSTATSMGFDSLNDLALLHVGTHGLKALSFSPAAQGATAAIVGYPLDGPRRLTPAAVADVLSISSRDVYNKVSFTRSLLGLSATVEPGNSGSPVFVHGRVTGVVVSKSLSQKNTAYAIPATVATAFIAHPTGTGFGACRK